MYIYIYNCIYIYIINNYILYMMNGMGGYVILLNCCNLQYFCGHFFLRSQKWRFGGLLGPQCWPIEICIQVSFHIAVMSKAWHFLWCPTCRLPWCYSKCRVCNGQFYQNGWFGGTPILRNPITWGMLDMTKICLSRSSVILSFRDEPWFRPKSESFCPKTVSTVLTWMWSDWGSTPSE